MKIQHKSSAVLGLLVAVAITASALTACSGDAAPAAPDTATSSVEATPELDPFEHDVLDWKKDTVTRIIDIGKERNESDTAILAALTASYGEVTWWSSLDGTDKDLFGWTSLNLTRLTGQGRQFLGLRNDPAYIAAAINYFYQRGHDLNLTTDNPVEYAIAVQTTDTRPPSVPGEPITYYRDRITERADNRFTDEDSVRKTYTEGLRYAEAAYNQLK